MDRGCHCSKEHSCCINYDLFAQQPAGPDDWFWEGMLA